MRMLLEKKRNSKRKITFSPLKCCFSIAKIRGAFPLGQGLPASWWSNSPPERLKFRCLRPVKQHVSSLRKAFSSVFYFVCLQGAMPETSLAKSKVCSGSSTLRQGCQQHTEQCDGERHPLGKTEWLAQHPNADQRGGNRQHDREYAALCSRNRFQARHP